MLPHSFFIVNSQFLATRSTRSQYKIEQKILQKTNKGKLGNDINK